MLQAILHNGAAQRRAVFEVFVSLPHSRWYGVVAAPGGCPTPSSDSAWPGRPVIPAGLRIVDETTLRSWHPIRLSDNVWAYVEDAIDG
jgi:hypothetical protein